MTKILMEGKGKKKDVDAQTEEFLVQQVGDMVVAAHCQYTGLYEAYMLSGFAVLECSQGSCCLGCWVELLCALWQGSCSPMPLPHLFCFLHLGIQPGSYGGPCCTCEDRALL